MPFAAKVVHVTMSGTMLGGGEIWQTGFWIGKPQGDAEVPTQGQADAIRDAWGTFFSNLNNGIHNSYKFEQVKLARLNIGGLYDASEVVTSTPAVAVSGGMGGSPLPPQIACVATLIAGSGKGLAGKGRMYLPGVSEALQGNGRIPTVTCNSIANTLAAFFNTVNAALGPAGEVINASKGQAKFAGINARNVPVNGVRVGNVYDTQRRRRSGLSETYSQAVVND